MLKNGCRGRVFSCLHVLLTTIVVSHISRSQLTTCSAGGRRSFVSREKYGWPVTDNPDDQGRDLPKAPVVLP